MASSLQLSMIVLKCCGKLTRASLQALDKIRFESLTDKSKLDGQPEFFIHIIPDKTNNTLTIIDSGVGMTKAGEFAAKCFVMLLMH